jgi:hypothetical protein
MSGFIRVIRATLAIAAAAIMLATASAPSQAQTGTVRLKIVKAGFIVGVGGGSGILNYRGRTYRLSIGGIGVGTIGIAEANLSGAAYNLRRPQDIAGTYAAAGAGLAVVGGTKVARLQNANGVVLELRGVQLGAEITLGLGGMTIALQ